MHTKNCIFPLFSLPVFSEEEPDLNNELEVSVCIQLYSKV